MNCPQCDQEISNKYLGKPVECPGCGKTVIVEANPLPSKRRRAEPEYAIPVANPPNALAVFNVFYGVLSIAGTVLLAAQFSSTPGMMLGVAIAGGGQALIFFSLSVLLNRSRGVRGTNPA